MKSPTLAPPRTAESFSPDALRPMTVAAPTCLRVLVAEDQPLVRRLMVRTIERLGHQVVAAEDGAQAWVLFVQQPADVVITDWLMPGMDGLDLCRRLRAESVNSAPYVILASVLDDPRDVQSGLTAGADEYLVKPIAREALEARLIAVEHMIRDHARQKASGEGAQRVREVQAVIDWRADFAVSTLYSWTDGMQFENATECQVLQADVDEPW